MSERTIAQWKAIPLAREEADPYSLKRERPEDEESDDDISIVSRTPSPSPEAMDIDDAHKYDEHVRGPAREVITVDTRIRPENKGFALLMKMGWTEGQPVGLSGDGRVDPIPFQLKNDSTGIGKVSQDVRMIETTVSQRRGLDSERQQKETEDQRQARENLVARKTAVETEISMTLQAFYCSLCDKQFKNVAQYDEHTNSYAHHHKARFRDMQANARIVPKEELEKRKEKERRREEKELRKIAAANGIKMPKPAGQPSTSTLTPVSDPILLSGIVAESKPPEATAKKGGWATISNSPTPQVGLRKSGWATVGSSLADPPPKASSSSGWSPAARAAQPTPIPPSSSSNHSTSAPAFRNAGWTSLEGGASQSPFSSPPNPPPPPPSEILPPFPSSFQPPPPPTSFSSQPVPPPPVLPSSSHAITSSPPPSQPGKSGWRQFQNSMKGRGRR